MTQGHIIVIWILTTICKLMILSRQRRSLHLLSTMLRSATRKYLENPLHRGSDAFSPDQASPANQDSYVSRVRFSASNPLFWFVNKFHGSTLLFARRQIDVIPFFARSNNHQRCIWRDCP